MKILKLIVIVCCTILTNNLFSQTVLIDYSSSWSYYDNANEPSNNGGMDWNDINYNASSWSQGSAQLGYGDSDENTVISSNTKTAYFRKNFTVADPNAFVGVDLELIFDDGAVVYLNGSEVWRQNMPNGTITYNTFASSSSSDNEYATNSIANSLVAGDNVLAVEVHQVSNTSSDISFDLKATASIPGSVNITRGPYLQKASASNITVRYRTASATQTIIKYGTNINNLNQTYSNTSPKTEHIAEISGLSPNTTYYYRLENSAAVLLPEATDIYFKTHPTIGTDQPITMWILGDCGTANNDQRDVRDAYYNYIGNNHTDGILFLGDNAYNDGTDAQYQNAIFSNMYEDKLKNTVAWSCLGNHDGYTANSSSQTGPYYDIFSFPTAGESGGVPSGTEAYYSFDYGNIHFIALESYETDRSVGGAMYNWALNDIQSTTQDWIVAYWHHPPYTKGSHDSDTESNLIQMRQNFLPMLESNGVDLVLSGHSHSYERSYFLNGHYGNANTFNPSTHTVGANGAGNGQSDGNGVYDKTITGPDAGDGAVYITTGSSGKVSGGSLNHQAMYYSVSQLGSCVLEVNGNQLDVKFVRETGSIDDYFTILKEEDCVVGTSCDDGDPCTVNDTYDSSCNCVGTDLPDSDNDGICDAEDQCPNLDNALIGTSCDDGDSQTENDTYGEDCICAGVPCSPAGTSCDDNDPTTYNDQTDGSCNCVGTPCPTAGTSCDDGDPTTINDVEDGFCNCAGQSISNTTCISISSGADDVEENEVTGAMYSNSTDLELVFDTYQSAGDQTIGMRFNTVDVPQGAFITNAYIQFTVDEVDTGTSNLTIEGEDTDNAASFGSTAFEITNRAKTQASVSWSPPAWNTVGDQTSDQQTPDISSIIQEIVDRPGYSTNNSMVLVITGTGVRTAESYNGSPSQAPQLCIEYTTICQTQGDSCDDGNDCTINDVIDANCNCAGTFQDSDSDGVCDADDICQGGDDNQDSDNDGTPDFCDSCDNNTTGNSCDDGDDCTTNDVIDANCDCVGTFQDSDSDGVCDADDICEGGDDNQDSDNDGTPDFCDSCDGNTVGNSCDDGNDCTVNDVIDANCNCAGTFQDSDNDGVCDADDICEGGDDNQDSDNDGIPDFCDSCDNNTTGNSCDDGDDCTVNDVIDANCNCVGTFQDSDSDGVCDADDICEGGDDNQDSDNDGTPDFCDSCDGNTVGNSCDDGNDCTINDVIDANCNCAGTFQDSDSDGVCDADDICQGGDDNQDGDNDGTPDFCDSCDNNTTGNSCDDGNDCTTNDVIDANCNCVGTFQDSDGDGVCDADDICQGGDDNQDSDNDGTPDFCDSCDNNTTGNSCDDGDDCTTNDVIDANCNCVGTFQDSDNDGVCDADDICPGSDDNQDSDNDGIPNGCDDCDTNTIGNACDDGNDCTVNDVIDANCNCAGIFQDSDDDGVCDADDICEGGDDNLDGDNDGIPDFCDNCDNNTTGNSCDDGDACTTNDVIDANCNCVGTFQDSDNDGVCDDNDICPGGDDNQDSDNDGTPDFCDSCDGNTVGNSCDDGNDCTVNDVIDANCNCAGTFQDSDGDGVCDADDICEGGDDNQDSDNDGTPDFCDSCDNNTTGNSCDDGDACTSNDVIDANCNCVGTFQDSDNDGVCDADDICPGSDDNQDDDNDGIPNGCDDCDMNTVGNSCDDGDDCTVNDVIDANCNCVGTFQDSDGDGVCDADDICEGGDDSQDSDNDGTPDFCDSCDNNTTGNSCDDGDDCTTNDAIDANCNCVGIFQDSDNDGVCDADDICPGSDDNQDDDNDGIPNGCDDCDMNTVGNSCDDGNACTTNDVIDANCNCVGTFQDSDGDGVCDADDICEGGDDSQDSDNDGTPNFCDSCDNNTTGNSCDDGDACTTNDVIDANCNCVGTFQDSDGDGVCDADDICEGGDDNQDTDNDGTPDFCDSCDNNTTGNQCDDGDACTTNDVIDTNCNCVGTFQDSDGDGVCDADDICEGGDDNQDSDNDGIPDFCDTCDNNTIGNSCDDGDACTTNDVIDANCNCVGTFQDSDGDGVCDAIDVCPGGDDNVDSDNDGLPDFCDSCDNNTTGNQCDDGNACTTNDVIDANCNCVGTFQDSDGDGVCDADDICEGGDDNQDSDNDGTPDFCDSCDDNTIGNSCDDGDTCTTNDVIDANCNCIGTFQDSDNDGVCDANDVCPGGDDNVDSDNDGIPDFCDTGCTDTDGDGQCDEDDPCPQDEYDACTLPDYCNSSGSNTSYEYIERVVLNTIDNTSGDNGGYGDFTNLNTTLSNGLSYDITLTPGFVSNAYNEVWAVWIDFNKDGDFEDQDELVLQDNSNGTINSSITIPNTVLNGITRMRVSMQYNNTPPACSNFTYGEVEDYYVIIENNCDEGDICDDGDACTENDVYDENCNCAGTIIPDSDGDGICDSEDLCPGMDDALIGQACDDNDPCTANDVYDSNCNCSGSYQDSDNDGICVGNDPDDNDACIPNADSPQCTPCDEILNHGFESGYGPWNDGGGDCTRRTQYANTGIYSVRLRDNSGSSSAMTSDLLDLSSYSELIFEFSYWPNSMENGEDFFLEISTNNGSSYTIYRSWVRGIDFNNSNRYDEEVTIDDITFTNQTRLRMRCDASGNGDQIYVDDVVLTGCNYTSGKHEVIIDKFGNVIDGVINNIASSQVEEEVQSSQTYEFENFEDSSDEDENEEEFVVFPNPTRNFLYLSGNWDDESNEVELLDIYGQRLLKSTVERGSKDDVKIDISHLPSGIYIVNFIQSNEIITSQKVVITNN